MVLVACAMRWLKWGLIRGDGPAGAGLSFFIIKINLTNKQFAIDLPGRPNNYQLIAAITVNIAINYLVAVIVYRYRNGVYRSAVWTLKFEVLCHVASFVRLSLLKPFVVYFCVLP